MDGAGREGWDMGWEGRGDGAVWQTAEGTIPAAEACRDQSKS